MLLCRYLKLCTPEINILKFCGVYPMISQVGSSGHSAFYMYVLLLLSNL